MIGVPDGGIGGRHSYSTSPMSSVHSMDHHRAGSFRISPINGIINVIKTKTIGNLHLTRVCSSTVKWVPIISSVYSRFPIGLDLLFITFLLQKC